MTPAFSQTLAISAVVDEAPQEYISSGGGGLSNMNPKSKRGKSDIYVAMREVGQPYTSTTTAKTKEKLQKSLRNAKES